jgi:hypothetical protein
LSAPADCPTSAFQTLDPFDQYGLRIAEEPAPESIAVPVRGDASASQRSDLDAFQWSLLAGLATLQVAYLVALARLASWAVHHLIQA